VLQDQSALLKAEARRQKPEGKNYQLPITNYQLPITNYPFSIPDFMQNTRINRFIDVLGEQFGNWLSNPWRRISLLVISLLFGTFLGTAISTIAGQSADWDILVAGLLVVLTELVNRLVYGARRQVVRFLWVDMLNALKIGMTYNLFVEALKLGS
jgi:Protein of unknown function (DUF565)